MEKSSPSIYRDVHGLKNKLFHLWESFNFPKTWKCLYLASNVCGTTATLLKGRLICIIIFVRVKSLHVTIMSADLKFIYSEKAKKFCKIFSLLLSVCTVDKSKGKISQNFVAFSEYMNFKVKYRHIVKISYKKIWSHSKTAIRWKIIYKKCGLRMIFK